MAWLRKAAVGTAKSAYETLEWLNRRSSAVEPRDFYDTADFPWVAGIEREWLSIRTELDDVLGSRRVPRFQDALPGQGGLTSGDNWKSFFLILLGHEIAGNMRSCPRTSALLGQIPGVQTAFFSILKPGTRIPPHRGPYNGVLRFHLGLIVPEPRVRCRIRVGREWRHWDEGRGLIFDDTIEHEVFNDTDGRRVVLFVDFLRPLRFPMSSVNAFVLRTLGRSRIMQRHRDTMAALSKDPDRQIDY
jgi:ornithine lipid ester-linked acyl 2-hydroxylase